VSDGQNAGQNDRLLTAVGWPNVVAVLEY